MSYFNHFELKQVKNRVNEFELVIFLDDFTTEFGNEFGVKTETRDNLFESAKKLASSHYPGIKVTMIRVMVSGMIFASFPISNGLASAQSNGEEPSVQETVSVIRYKVQSGDTLWNLSQKYKTTINDIKTTNNLESNTLQLNQQILIPKAFHTVASGDYLSTLAKQYNVTADAIREANQLNGDKILIGQVLIIPHIIQNTAESVILPASPPVEAQPSTSYKVVAGDSLSIIAKRFGLTVDAIKSANQIQSDTIQIGQELTLPGGVKGVSSEVPTVETYTVKTGDTLSGIAKQYNLSTNFLIINNQLTTGSIQAGQVLKLKENFIKGDRNQIGKIKVLKTTGLYSKDKAGNLTFVKSLPVGGGYSVYSIDYDHKLYNVGGNNWMKISSDSKFTRLGEVPSLTSSAAYVTHTVKSGDTIWGLSVKYGIPQSELLKVNSLKLNSQLSVGQRLTVPQYKIAVKQTVSSRHGEHLDWWSEAQYVLPIGKSFKVTDFATGKSFMVKRTIGANHADCETLTTKDTIVAKGIWKGFSWKERAVIIEVDGRKIAASMSFMPHDVEYIKNNGINGHFDIHFKNSTRHKDGKIDYHHQNQVNIAAGVKAT